RSVHRQTTSTPWVLRYHRKFSKLLMEGSGDRGLDRRCTILIGRDSGNGSLQVRFKRRYATRIPAGVWAFPRVGNPRLPSSVAPPRGRRYRGVAYLDSPGWPARLRLCENPHLTSSRSHWP